MTDDRITIVFDDIFEQDVEAIVNPANRFMLHGGGLAGEIARRGGTAVVLESREQVERAGSDGILTGECILTGPGALPFRAIIHVVGPVYEEDDLGRAYRENNPPEPVDELLHRAHVSVIEKAAEAGLASVAFPAVSCGVFGYPVEEAAPIALRATQEALEAHPSVERVVFCVMNEHHLQAFEEAAAES